jgi:cbb3-type cytochrome oxidase subunit 3
MSDGLSKPRTESFVYEADVTVKTKMWIALGVFWMAVFFYCLFAWVLGPDFRPVTFGRDQASAAYVTFLKSLEMGMLALTLWLIWRFVIRPVVRTGRFSFDGLYYLACFTLVVQEPWHSWIRPQLLYNDIFFNMGSWMGTLPVSNPTAYLTPVPLAFAGLGYFWIYGGPAHVGSLLMARAKRRNPSLSAIRMIICTFLGFCVFDFFLESFILRTGMFVYPSTIPQLTLFAGETYQYPLYEMIAWAGSYTCAACLHHFRNEIGESIADRGVATFVRAGWKRTLASWLAMVGYLQIGLLLTFNVPYMFYALHGGPFTVTEKEQPWLTAGICGPSTAFDCPSPGVPFARRESPTNRIAAEAIAPAENQGE